jgi:hypothetical protein
VHDTLSLEYIKAVQWIPPCLSLLSDWLKNVGTGVRFTPSLILLNVFRVELVASADLPLICVSSVMQSHVTSCTGRERARSGMEGQGCSCTRGAFAAGGERFAMLTIVICILFSVSRIDPHQEDYHYTVGSLRFVFICIHCVLLGLLCLTLYTFLWLLAFLVSLRETTFTPLPFSLSVPHRSAWGSLPISLHWRLRWFLLGREYGMARLVSVAFWVSALVSLSRSGGQRYGSGCGAKVRQLRRTTDFQKTRECFSGVRTTPRALFIRIEPFLLSKKADSHNG